MPQEESASVCLSDSYIHTRLVFSRSTSRTFLSFQVSGNERIPLSFPLVRWYFRFSFLDSISLSHFLSLALSPFFLSFSLKFSSKETE